MMLAAALAWHHVGDLHHHATGAMRGLGPGLAVFEHQAARGRDAEQGGGQQIRLRVGLGRTHVIQRDDMGEGLRDPGDAQLAMRPAQITVEVTMARGRSSAGPQVERAGFRRQGPSPPVIEPLAPVQVDRMQVEPRQRRANDPGSGGFVLADEAMHEGFVHLMTMRGEGGHPVTSAMLSVSIRVPSRSKRIASYIGASAPRHSRSEMQPVVGKALAIAGKLLWAVTGNVLQIGGSAGSDRKRHRGPWHQQEVPVALRRRADAALALDMGRKGLRCTLVPSVKAAWRSVPRVLQPCPPGPVVVGDEKEPVGRGQRAVAVTQPGDPSRLGLASLALGIEARGLAEVDGIGELRDGLEHEGGHRIVQQCCIHRRRDLAEDGGRALQPVGQLSPGQQQGDEGVGEGIKIRQVAHAQPQERRRSCRARHARRNGAAEDNRGSPANAVPASVARMWSALASAIRDSAAEGAMVAKWLCSGTAVSPSWRRDQASVARWSGARA